MHRIVVLGAGAVLAAAVAAAGSLANGSPHGTPKTAALPNAALIFTRHVTKPAHDDLYVAAADGSQPRLLAHNAADAGVSPDGRRIAFVRGRALWIMRSDGSRQRQLTRPGKQPDTMGMLSDFAPAWSPDGRTLYFVRAFGEDGALLSASADGTHLATLATGSRWYIPDDPAPSPNGRLVAFDKVDGAHWCCGGIIAVTRAGKEATLPFRFPKLGQQDMYDISYHPSWSPDGRQLAYAHNGDTTSQQLFVSRADGSAPRLLADGSAPVWSPDGGWIAFSSGGIALVRPDGSGLRRLAKSKASDHSPAWLPPFR